MLKFVDDFTVAESYFYLTVNAFTFKYNEVSIAGPKVDKSKC